TRVLRSSGISPLWTMSYSLLAAGRLGVTAGPDSPPARMPSAVLRSSPPFLTFRAWHRRQFLSKIGRMSLLNAGSFAEAWGALEGVAWKGPAQALTPCAAPSTITITTTRIPRGRNSCGNGHLMPDTMSLLPLNQLAVLLRGTRVAWAERFPQH